MKTIQLTDVKVIEVQISFAEATPSLNVLYALTDAHGNQYNKQWRLFKGDRVSSLADKLNKVLEKTISNVKEDEGM